MSDEQTTNSQQTPPWEGEVPPAGCFGFPPYNPMMQPFMHSGMYPGMHPGMHLGMHQGQNMHQVPPGMSDDMAQYHAQMHAMAMQQAQAMQHQMHQQHAMQQQAMQQQAMAYHQAMMAAQAGDNNFGPQSDAGDKAKSDSEHPHDPFANDPMMAQAQAMLDGAMGEEDAGMFKEILGTLGMNDKEFWKGAVVGAAAALILSNENVRGKLMGLVGGAGDMLKSGGSTVKDGAMSTAASVKENVSAGGEIFRDTYQAGKEGFKDSVERHKQPKEADVEAPEDGAATE